MPVLNVYDIDKNVVAEITLNDAVFGGPVNEHIIHEVVRAQQASRRRGTASTKGRSEVSGGGKKPWRQKGTGRARVGTLRSPIWRGGGIVFGPKPHEFSLRVPKKVRKAALRSALSMKVRENKTLIIRGFSLDEIKTKKFKEILDRFELTNTLVVIDRENRALELSSRNIRDVKMMRAEGINVYDLLKYDTLVLLEPSVQIIEGALLS